MEGRVTINVKTDLNGHAFDCRVVESSGHDILDRATCEQVEQLAHFNPALDQQGNPVIGSFTTSVNWKWPG